MAADASLVYADASALVKLVLDESETGALRAYLERTQLPLATSAIALIEVRRAVKVAYPERDMQPDADAVVEACELVGVTERLIAAAANLASPELRTLDAIHLASALEIGADAMLAYDRRLAGAAGNLGLRLVQPA